MKTPSLRKYSARSSRNSLASPAAFAAGLLAIFVLVLSIIRFAAPDTFIALAVPFWRAGTALSASVAASTEGFSSTASLVRSRDMLARENDALNGENRLLTARNQDLQNLLGSRTEASNGVLAAVLARPPVAPYDVLVVDQGTSMRVVLGATAYGPGGTPVYVAGVGAIPVGVVVQIGNDPSSPNVSLAIHPYLNPFSLTWVTIGPAPL